MKSPTVDTAGTFYLATLPAFVSHMLISAFAGCCLVDGRGADLFVNSEIDDVSRSNGRSAGFAPSIDERVFMNLITDFHVCFKGRQTSQPKRGNNVYA